MRKQIIIAVTGFAATTLAFCWFLARNHPPEPADAARKTLEMPAKKILTKAEAIRIAKEYWRTTKGTEMREDRPVDVSLDIGKNEYTVLFKTAPLPPDTVGADFHAKFLIDATTGKVKQAMVGS